MSESADSPTIYIIEDGSAVCPSMHAILEASDHSVRSICDAECFSRDVVQPGLIKPEDIILIDLDASAAATYRLINMMIEDPDSPGFIMFTDNDGSFLSTDKFPQSRLEVLHMPITPQSLLAGIEAVQ